MRRSLCWPGRRSVAHMLHGGLVGGSCAGARQMPIALDAGRRARRPGASSPERSSPTAPRHAWARKESLALTTHAECVPIGSRCLARPCTPPLSKPSAHAGHHLSLARHALSTLRGHTPAVGICGTSSKLPWPCVGAEALAIISICSSPGKETAEIASAFRGDQNCTWPRANQCSRHCEQPRDDAKACCSSDPR